MAKAPAFQFYPGDWRRDTQVQMATMETRGVWFELLCCMWFAPEKGKIEGRIEKLAILLHCEKETLINSMNEIYELKIGDISAVNGDGSNVTFPLHVTHSNIFVTIQNRRMFREDKTRESTRLRVQRHRDKKTSNADVTPPSPSSPVSPSSPTPNKDLPKGKLRTKPCPHQSIIDQYHKILPTLTNIQVWDKTSKQNLKVRWREDPIRQDIEFWKTYFTWIKESNFLMGENDRGWMPDLHWLVKPTNFAKVINGRYHNNQNLTDRLRKVGYRWLEKKKEIKDI